MEAVTIHDGRAFGNSTMLAYDLKELITIGGHDALASTWICTMVECLGPGAERMHEAADLGRNLVGSELAVLAADITQTIDGVFEATLPGECKPWLVFRAIDGCYFVVVTSSRTLMAEIRSRFHDVRPSPEDAEWYA